MANKTETATLNVKSNIGEVQKDAAGLASEFKIMGVSLNSVKAGFASVGKAAKASFATIKAGIISTGIGALLLAVTALISYFTNTKRGADQLKQAMAALGAVVDAITDQFSKLGELMVKAFQDPQKAVEQLWMTIKENLLNRLDGLVAAFSAAGKVISAVLSLDFEEVTQGAKELGEAMVMVGTGLTPEQQEALIEKTKELAAEIAREARAMAALEKRTQQLRDADNAFMIQKAATRQEIERARLIAEDETKTAQERLDNLKLALELEAETTEKEIKLAKERMLIKKQEMALSENSAEDERELAQLKADIIEKETASIKMRRRVVTEVNALEREILAEEKARAKEKQDILDAEAKKAEELANKEIEEAKRVAKEKMDILKAEQAFRDKTIGKGFQAAAAMAGENAELSKGIAAAQTIYQTQQGVMAALGATSVGDKLLPYPVRLANAIATGAMGAVALAKILSTDSSGSGASAGAGGGGGGGSATPAPQMMSGAFELTGGAEPEPLKAFVVTDEMTNSQNQLANIRRRATI